MSPDCPSRIILMADDDVEDRQLVRHALDDSGLDHELRCVCDGVELFEYLRGEGEYANGKPAPWPDVILLDFKMPRMDGREVLAKIKTDPQLRRIPVVALTTSAAEDDISFSYDSGVNSFVSKPTSFREWVEILRIICEYWFRVVELPPPPKTRNQDQRPKT
jgi:two-component system, response regulator